MSVSKMGTAKIMNYATSTIQKEKVIVPVNIEVAGCDKARYNHKYNDKDDYFFHLSSVFFKIMTID